MKILYVASKYDYGKAERGFSFEHFNFFETFLKTGNEIIYFDFISIMRQIGKKSMNALLKTIAHNEKPDIVFTFLCEYEINPETIQALSKSENFYTLNWFADDHWRYDNYSKYFTPFFNWVVTTDKKSYEKYIQNNQRNVILSQWACNHFVYQKKELPYKYDISFVGQAHGNRRREIEEIRQHNFDVQTRGAGWKDDRVTQSEMVDFFNQSRINLNFSDSSVFLPENWLSKFDKYLLYRNHVKGIWRRIRSFSGGDLSRQIALPQIKGRNFEIPGSGGFLLTNYLKGIEQYYEENKEIVCFRNENDLIEKIKYYFSHDTDREQIAKNGWVKTLACHTYVHRFNEIFRTIGINSLFDIEEKHGSCIDISENL